MTSKKLLVVVAIVVLTCAFSGSASVDAAQKSAALEGEIRSQDLSKAVPALLNYQGFLATADSGAVTATLAMTFRLYGSASGGTALWSETHPAVVVHNGGFTLLLGSVTPFPANLFDGATLYLQMEVGSEVFTPRKAIVSVAYSLKSNRADSAEYASDALHAVRADTAAYLSGAGTWTVSGNNVYRLTGNVGIGTASPTTRLDVVGNVDADGFTINGTPIGTSTDTYWSKTGDNIHYSAGNVGIGTATPTARLQVEDGKGNTGSLCTSGYVVYGEHSTGNKGFIGSADGGVYGQHPTDNNKGWLGGETAGVEGYSDHLGVYGENSQSGRYGWIGTDNAGVYGATASGGTYGFLGGFGEEDFGAGGVTFSDGGKGVYGFNNVSVNSGWLGGENYGAYGQNGNGNEGFLGSNDYGAAGENSSGNRGYLGTSQYGAFGQHSNGNWGALGDEYSGAYGQNSNGNFGLLGDIDLGAYGQNANGNYGSLGDGNYGVYAHHNNGNWGYIGGTVGARGQNSNGNYGNLGDGGNGVYGRHNNGNQGFVGHSSYGVMGLNSNGYFGYLGKNDTGAAGQSTNNNLGVLGTSEFGVAGAHSSGNGGYIGGGTRGMEGYHASGNFGILGNSDCGVRGQSSNANFGLLADQNYAVYGQHNNGNKGWIGNVDYGLYGYSGTLMAIAGAHSSGNLGYIANANHAVYGAHSNGNVGTLGRADCGVYGYEATGEAGYFVGSVWVTGMVAKGSGSFKIDHPLDPENKYLYHSFVESPDMMNVYNGNVVLEAGGAAWVELPEWFDVVNRDFRYQLTCIGGFAPVYIADKVSGNRFRIAGGEPGMEVSWQITGIRQDPYANLHRIPVEEDKPPQEQGTYLHADAYGQPVERSLAWARDPEMSTRAEEVQATSPQREETVLQTIFPVSVEALVPVQSEEKPVENIESRGRLHQPVPEPKEQKER